MVGNRLRSSELDEELREEWRQEGAKESPGDGGLVGWLTKGAKESHMHGIEGCGGSDERDVQRTPREVAHSGRRGRPADPLVGNHVGAWWMRHRVPSVVGQEGRILFHSVMPVGIDEGGENG